MSSYHTTDRSFSVELSSKSDHDKIDIKPANQKDEEKKATSEEISDWFFAVYYRFRRFVIHARNPQQPVSSLYNNPFLKYIDNYFRITTWKSTIRTEIIGGITSFLTAAYIMTLNPIVLSICGIDADANYVITALLAGLGSITMGLFVGMPIVLAPGVGLSATIANVYCISLGYSWQSTLGLTTAMGLITLILSIFGIRRKLILAIPEYLRIGIAVGIALFLALLGAKDMSVLSATSGLALAPITWRFGLSCLSFIVLNGLITRGFKAAYICTILGTAVLSIIIKSIINTDDVTIGEFGNLDVSSIAFQLNFDFYASAAYILPLFFISHVFDAVATSLTLIRQAYFSDTQIEVNANELDNKLATSSVVRDILVVDSLFVILSGLLGSGPTTPFIESAVGISVGARTGLASVVSGLLFLVSIFIGPIIPYIVPGEATGPALLTTAVLFTPFLQNLNYTKHEEIVPAIIAMIMIPYTSSIADGSALGYCALLSFVVAGKARQLHWLTWILIVMGVFQIISSLLYTYS